MNVVGINVEPKRGNLPNIKPKSSQSIKNQGGGVIFDSHFESGNLLFAYRNNDYLNKI